MRMRHAAVVAGLALGLMSGTAKASYLFTFSQIGNNVVLTGSGEINTSILKYESSTQVFASAVQPNLAFAQVGPGVDPGDFYSGISGPSSFGNGGFTAADDYSGTFAYLYGQGNQVAVDPSYISGTFMSGSGTFSNATLSSLGLTPGTYTYTYSGQVQDLALLARAAFVPPTITDTIIVQVGTVPLPASAPMFGAALLGLAGIGYAAKRKKAAAAA